jgi:hypothetical protein
LKNINNEKIKLKARKATNNIYKSEHDQNPAICSTIYFMSVFGKMTNSIAK